MLPERVLHEHGSIRAAMEAIAGLPPAQRAVIRMRNVQGCDADKACAALELSEGNEPVLLHRARSRAPRSKGTSMAESHDHVSCTEVVELVTDYLERALPPDAAALVEQHLNCCEGCVWYVDQIRTTIEALGRIAPEEVPYFTVEVNHVQLTAIARLADAGELRPPSIEIFPLASAREAFARSLKRGRRGKVVLAVT